MNLTPQDLHELKTLEEQLWIAEFRYNHAWLEKILAEDFFEFGQSGRRYSRDECLNTAQENIGATLPLPMLTIHDFGHGIAHITYKSIVTDDDTTNHSNRSSIWIKTSNGWKLKFHQGTPTSA